MKKAIKILVMSVVVAFLYTLAMLIGTSFPPGDAFTQNAGPVDTSMTLEQQKALLSTAERNNQVAAAMESVKPEKHKERIVYRERKVFIPVVQRRKPETAASKPPDQKQSQPPVTVIFQAPKYHGTEIRKKMTYAEWKMQRGLLQSKSYRLYQKYLDGQRN